MKGVFKDNKDLKYLKEEFKTFVQNKEAKENKTNVEESNELPKETLVLEEV